MVKPQLHPQHCTLWAPTMTKPFVFGTSNCDNQTFTYGTSIHIWKMEMTHLYRTDVEKEIFYINSVRTNLKNSDFVYHHVYITIISSIKCPI